MKEEAETNTFTSLLSEVIQPMFSCQIFPLRFPCNPPPSFAAFHLERGQMRPERQVRHSQGECVAKLVVSTPFWQHQQAVTEPERGPQEKGPRGVVKAQMVQLLRWW